MIREWLRRRRARQAAERYINGYVYAQGWLLGGGPVEHLLPPAADPRDERTRGIVAAVIDTAPLVRRLQG